MSRREESAGPLVQAAEAIWSGWLEGLCHKIMGDSPDDEATDPTAATAAAEQVRSRHMHLQADTKGLTPDLTPDASCTEAQCNECAHAMDLQRYDESGLQTTVLATRIPTHYSH